MLHRAHATAEGGTDEVESLRAERDQYQQQVTEMTRFLQDYGLTWVGDTHADGDEADSKESDSVEAEVTAQGDGDSTQATFRSPKSRSLGAQDVPVDIQVLNSRVEVLNAMVERSGARVVS